MAVDRRRVRVCNDKSVTDGPVVYWMRRDQRVQDNWALLYAKEEAQARKVPLVVVFTLFVIPARANLRQYDFMFGGLKEVEMELKKLNIVFYLLEGKSEEVLTTFALKHKVGMVVTDFNPLAYAVERRTAVASQLPCQLVEVDAHNIIPVWEASDKEEFAAYTFRPKVHRLLSEFLTPFPKVTKQTFEWISKVPVINWELVLKKLPLDTSVMPVTHIMSGSKAAERTLTRFISVKLDDYHEKRNDPTQNGVSGLSPYLHFGQISAQRVALVASEAHDSTKEAREAFLEELIVRRELADNYCYYNKNHSSLKGAHAWAQKTLQEHRNDVREYTYTKNEFEFAQTHDELWNAMQLQMVHEGKMHGWCRMYWAKKILEWTPDVETAIDTALHLNDKYEIDGNDPNGVVGVMWSICGVHDRAWNERPIFGKVRYMNYAGARRKFDIKSYIEKYGREKTLFR